MTSLRFTDDPDVARDKGHYYTPKDYYKGPSKRRPAEEAEQGDFLNIAFQPIHEGSAPAPQKVPMGRAEGAVPEPLREGETWQKGPLRPEQESAARYIPAKAYGQESRFRDFLHKNYLGGNPDDIDPDARGKAAAKNIYGKEPKQKAYKKEYKEALAEKKMKKAAEERMLSEWKLKKSEAKEREKAGKAEMKARKKGLADFKRRTTLVAKLMKKKDKGDKYEVPSGVLKDPDIKYHKTEVEAGDKNVINKLITDLTRQQEAAEKEFGIREEYPTDVMYPGQAGVDPETGQEMVRGKIPGKEAVLGTGRQPQKRDPSRRPDGTKKGPGFLGTIDRPGGGVSTELSIGINMDGKNTLIPLLVPSLNKDEINFLLQSQGDPSRIPKGIIDKAVNHARQRIKAGESPFAGEGEQSSPIGNEPVQAGSAGFHAYRAQAEQNRLKLEQEVKNLTEQIDYIKQEIAHSKATRTVPDYVPSPDEITQKGLKFKPTSGVPKGQDPIAYSPQQRPVTSDEYLNELMGGGMGGSL